jgi:glycosyltransferase involved in cell wall biosynthesis
MKRFKLAVVATHPIQYHAPWYRALAADPRFDVHVFYCHRATAQDQAGAGFGVAFEWDRPLLEGYRHSFLANVSRRPSVSTFAGIDTPELTAIIARSGFDACLVNGWNHKSAWQAIFACWRTGTKVMVRGDSHLRTARGVLKRVAKALPYRAFVPRLNACLAAGTWSREYYLHYGARPEKVFVVPHVVDEAWLAAEAVRLQPQRAGLRRRWALPEHGAIFLFAGKLTEKKRPLDFLAALERAAGQVPVHALMVGDGPLRAACEAHVRSRNLPVSFAGFLNQSEMPAAYVAADALVLPSDGGETWGLVVNEAMICGKPCLVSDHVGCGPDLVREGETGAVFALGHIAPLAAHMVRLATDAEACRRMGMQARDLMRDWSSAAAVEGVAAAVSAVTRG